MDKLLAFLQLCRYVLYSSSEHFSSAIKVTYNFCDNNNTINAIPDDSNLMSIENCYFLNFARLSLHKHVVDENQQQYHCYTDD